MRAGDVSKRVFDVVGAALLLVVLSPVLAATALAVLLDDGRPVLFRQPRLGLKGRVFLILKFRTMRVGSERQAQYNADGSVRTIASDPRVTRTGRFLRATSLDELPQLINVLSGDMSLVGPRPDLPIHLEHYDERDRLKLEVRPGITGLAQVEGRNGIPWKERLRLDVEYVGRRSLMLDLGILLKTARLVVRREGLYQETTS